MKKLYTNKGPKRVHPSPPPPPPPPSPSLLSILPAALLALASALSAEEQEVLAYLLGSGKPPRDSSSSSSSSKKQNKKHSCNKKQQQQQQLVNNHPPDLGCSCFGCYKSFWARWDASPNRHAIHLIIDAFEEKEAINLEKLNGKSSSSSRKKRSSTKRADDGGVTVTHTDLEEMMSEVADDQKLSDDAHAHDDGYDGYGDDDDDDDEIEVDEEGKSSVRRFVSWVFGINN